MLHKILLFRVYFQKIFILQDIDRLIKSASSMETSDGSPGPVRSRFESVDPAPPHQLSDISKLRDTLVDTSLKMFERMRAVFSLRNSGKDEAVYALCEAFSDDSALLRHEVAYVLGQIQNKAALPTLFTVLENEDEHVMVRHEAAEAMGAIGCRSSIPILEKYLKNPSPEISESCEVALDLLHFCLSKEYENTEW